MPAGALVSLRYNNTELGMSAGSCTTSIRLEIRYDGRMHKISGLLAATLLFVGCAAVTLDLPSITDEPTGIRSDGRVVWRDLITTTPAESRRFYGELFGWTFHAPGVALGFGGDESYMLIRHEGRLIGGMLDGNTLEAEEEVSQWITVISVDDIAAAVSTARQQGGEILTEPTYLPSRGTLAVLRDHEGALFAMIETRDGDPEQFSPEFGDFLWDEVWSGNVTESAEFYQSVVGYSAASPDAAGLEYEYRVMSSAGEPRAGIMRNPFKELQPVWINYLRVADPEAVASKVEALGGQVIVPAQPRDIGGSVALVAGPSGAGIALQSWSEESSE